MLTIQLFFQSSGILPSLTTALHMSVTHCTPASPEAFSISTSTPDGPAAFPLLALDSADRTSCTEKHSHGPLTASTSPNPSRFHSNSSFNNVSKYSFYTSFTSSSSTITRPTLFFTLHAPTTSPFFLAICFTTLNNSPFASAVSRFSDHSCLLAACALPISLLASLFACK